MSYVLVVFAILLIVSSVLWVKPSARQKRIAQMRSVAMESGLQVQLSKAPDAREGEGRLDHVQYSLFWKANSIENTLADAENWLLVKGTRRGDPSKWSGWQWLDKSAPQALEPIIAAALPNLPEDIKGLRVNHKGVAIYWQEQGEPEDVRQVAEIIKNLQSAIRPK